MKIMKKGRNIMKINNCTIDINYTYNFAQSPVSNSWYDNWVACITSNDYTAHYRMK